MPFFVGISCPLQSSYCLKSTLGSFFHSETLTYRPFCKGLKRRAAIVLLSLSIRVTMTRLLMFHEYKSEQRHRKVLEKQPDCIGRTIE